MTTPQATPSKLVFGREPAVWTTAVMAVVALVVGFGFNISTDTQSYIQAAVNAVLGLIIVINVRENVLPAIVTLIGAVVPLAVALGLNLTTDQQTLILAAAPILLNLVIVRPQVTTKADPAVVV